MALNCIICGNKNIITKPNIQGYIEDTNYTVNCCDQCKSNFVDSKNIDPKIYELIYSNSNTPGYDRYYQFAQEIKNQNKPLQYLALKDQIYFPTYYFLKNKSNLKILDIGCGYGYITYAMNASGHTATGIDISNNAITIAKKIFGNNYFCSDVNSFKKSCSHKFDLIVVHEVVEHLTDIHDFIKTASSLLTNNGTMLITTPNKDAAYPTDIWQTDPPPIHLLWLGKKSFEAISQTNNLNIKFMNYFFYPASTNNLTSFLFQRFKKILKGHQEVLPGPFLSKDNIIIPPKSKYTENEKRGTPLKNFFKYISNIVFIKFISNLIYYYVLQYSDATLVILLTKKPRIK